MQAHVGKVAPFALLFTAVIATTAAAQPVPPGPGPSPPEGCRIWEAHIRTVIEKHKNEGTSEAALAKALSLAYAAYGQSAICATDKDMNDNAVAALEKIRIVLSQGRTFALRGPDARAAAARELQPSD